MQDLKQNLALQVRPVNLATTTQLRQAIRTYAMLTTGAGSEGVRRTYFRRLQLLAAGSPRAMNFAPKWCCALHYLSDKAPTGTFQRQETRRAWREMFSLVGDAVQQIRTAIAAGQ